MSLHRTVSAATEGKQTETNTPASSSWWWQCETPVTQGALPQGHYFFVSDTQVTKAGGFFSIFLEYQAEKASCTLEEQPQ